MYQLKWLMFISFLCAGCGPKADQTAHAPNESHVVIEPPAIVDPPAALQPLDNTPQPKVLDEPVEIESDVVVSAEMQDFVSLIALNSGAKSTEAMNKYAAADIDDEAMVGIFAFKEAVVKKREEFEGGERYTVRVKAGLLARNLVVTWKDGKITSTLDVFDNE